MVKLTKIVFFVFFSENIYFSHLGRLPLKIHSYRGSEKEKIPMDEILVGPLGPVATLRTK